MADVFWLLTIPLLIIPIAFIVLWVFMFLDLLSTKKLIDTDKIIWGIALIVIPFTAILYYFVVYSKNKKSPAKRSKRRKS